ncbi:MAG: DoxX family membrane protein [Desulfobacteraceae bacterium]|nr:DoxX family membrane protein [Desulfobacteraceae bacterium]MBC2757175.1 DoxX family membrane protein [Desulfobacteraceae bacterium]
MNTPNSLKIHHIISIIVRFILGAIFITAGIPKILDTASFAGVIYNYHLLPDMLINIFAIALPWLEVIIGCMLVIGFWMPGTVILYNLLMIAFIGALVFNIARGLDISCGCFSTDSGDLIDMGTIFRDIIILIASMYLIFVVFIKKITSDNIFAKK